MMNKPNTTVNPYIPKARNVLKSGFQPKSHQGKDTERKQHYNVNNFHNHIIQTFKKQQVSLSSSIKIRPIPRRITKSITCNMLPLLKALKIIWNDIKRLKKGLLAPPFLFSEKHPRKSFVLNFLSILY
jgi:hypothetical protein